MNKLISFRYRSIHSPPAFLLSELHPSRASQAPPPSRKLPQTPGAILPPSYFSSGPFSTTEHWRYRDLSAESTNAPDRTPHGGGTGGQPRTSTVGPAPPLDFRLWEALKGFDLWKGPFHHTISPFTMRKHHCTIGSIRYEAPALLFSTTLFLYIRTEILIYVWLYILIDVL